MAYTVQHVCEKPREGSKHYSGAGGTLLMDYLKSTPIAVQSRSVCDAIVCNSTPLHRSDIIDVGCTSFSLATEFAKV